MQPQSTRIPRVCEVCATPFTIKPSRVGMGGHQAGRWCSNACKGAGMVTAIDRTCDHCGAPYKARASTFAIGMGRYCSKSCSNAARAIPADVRFWKLVDKSDADGCWLWTGARDHHGYGLFTLRPGNQQTAHRFSYILANGPIPDEMKALHRCDNPPCVRPDHLFAGTNQDNMTDMVEKNRQRRGEAHGRAKLTEDDVRAIRTAFEAGESPYTIAPRYGVDPKTIYDAALRRHWKHIL